MKNSKLILLVVILCLMVGCQGPDAVNKQTKKENNASHLKKFIISILQKKGIPCVDELFNLHGIYPGAKSGKVFGNKKSISYKWRR